MTKRLLAIGLAVLMAASVVALPATVSAADDATTKIVTKADYDAYAKTQDALKTEVKFIVDGETKTEKLLPAEQADIAAITAWATAKYSVAKTATAPEATVNTVYAVPGLVKTYQVIRTTQNAWTKQYAEMSVTTAAEITAATTTKYTTNQKVGTFANTASLDSIKTAAGTPPAYPGFAFIGWMQLDPNATVLTAQYTAITGTNKNSNVYLTAATGTADQITNLTAAKVVGDGKVATAYVKASAGAATQGFVTVQPIVGVTVAPVAKAAYSADLYTFNTAPVTGYVFDKWVPMTLKVTRDADAGAPTGIAAASATSTENETVYAAQYKLADKTTAANYTYKVQADARATSEAITAEVDAITKALEAAKSTTLAADPTALITADQTKAFAAAVEKYSAAAAADKKVSFKNWAVATIMVADNNLDYTVTIVPQYNTLKEDTYYYMTKDGNPAKKTMTYIVGSQLASNLDAPEIVTGWKFDGWKVTVDGLCATYSKGVEPSTLPEATDGAASFKMAETPWNAGSTVAGDTYTLRVSAANATFGTDDTEEGMATKAVIESALKVDFTAVGACSAEGVAEDPTKAVITMTGAGDAYVIATVTYKDLTFKKMFTVVGITE